jgi:hypothetical protein
MNRALDPNEYPFYIHIASSTESQSKPADMDPYLLTHKHCAEWRKDHVGTLITHVRNILGPLPVL